MRSAGLKPARRPRYIEVKAEHEISLLKVENRLALQDRRDRAAERMRGTEERRQRNLESIACKAAKHLESKESVSEKPVDEDWVYQFMNVCQDVGDEQMQSLWAKLLAGEVEKPGRYSRRTMEFIRTISKEEADLFTRCCSMLWRFGGVYGKLFPYVPVSPATSFIESISLKYVDIIALSDIGLVRYGDTAYRAKFNNAFSPPMHNQKYAMSMHAWYFSELYILSREVDRPEPSTDLTVGHVLLTDTGAEIALISGAAPNEEYREWALGKLREAGWRVQAAESPASGDVGSP